MSRVDEPLNPAEAHMLQPWVAHYVSGNVFRKQGTGYMIIGTDL